FYPPLVLLVLARGTVAGLNTCVVLHVLWGCLGAYTLTYTLGRRRMAALVAGLLFGYAYFTRDLTLILPLEVVASAWIPWTLALLVRAVDGRDWLRPTVLAALAYSFVPWVGGFIQFLPGLLVVGCIVGLGSLRRPLSAHLLRGLAILMVFTGLMGLLSLGKLLPMLRWSELTDRAGGIAREFALGGSMSPAQVLEYTLNEGWIPWALAAAGLAFALRRRFDWVVPVAASIALLILASGRSGYGFLYDYVPGFDHVREPNRVWLLMAAVLPAAAGLGVGKLQDGLARRLGASRGPLLAAAAILLAALAADRVVYSRFRTPVLLSLSERMAANAIHQDLARRAREEPRFRVVELAKTRPRVKQTADLMRSVFGLESIEGILGNVSILTYDLEFLTAAKAAPARTLGVLNARYVLSTDPIEEPGLEFLEQFEPDPLRPYDGYDGPLLYRNTLAVPRAALLDHAFLQVGGSPYWRRLMLLSPSWQPQSALLIAESPLDVSQIASEELAQFDFAILFRDLDPSLGLDERMRGAGLARYVIGSSSDEDLLKAMAATTHADSPLQALPDPPREWNGMHLELPPDAGGRWLMLAETYANYPGWTAEVDGRPARLWHANGIATAILLPAGARDVRLRYVPPGFVAGMAGSAAGLLLCGVVLLRRRGQPPSGSDRASLTTG
ncbi:MAG TPA: hypothetical protein VES36_10440, partial [Candidatus Limnocylindrales bacterium]|nr:hypothetical protein [Candidatus Limnocylindrales bacterium]